ncbi:hypothetical protein ERJ75_000552500 [Trypanosoma vivax]|nr:hypothetical protein ERJ75_000552500 [Trypanosoma vivax]
MVSDEGSLLAPHALAIQTSPLRHRVWRATRERRVWRGAVAKNVGGRTRARESGATAVRTGGCPPQCGSESRAPCVGQWDAEACEGQGRRHRGLHGDSALGGRRQERAQGGTSSELALNAMRHCGGEVDQGSAQPGFCLADMTRCLERARNGVLFSCQERDRTKAAALHFFWGTVRTGCEGVKYGEALLHCGVLVRACRGGL